MGEADLVISQLRSQVNQLKELLSYIEKQGYAKEEDVSFINRQLKEIISQLKIMGKFSAQRGESYRFRSQWLN